MTCTCHCHNKEPHAYHEEGCPMRDHPDSLKARISEMKEINQIAAKARDFWIGKAQIWEGKFHAVKRENNALRKALHRKETK